MVPTIQNQPSDPNTAAFLREAGEAKFDFHSISVKAAGDERLKNAVSSNTQRQYDGRQQRMLELPDADGLRSLAGDIKQHALDNLDYYLEQLQASVEKNGGQVHFARTGDDARRIISDIAKKAGCTRIIKSKSMASEEIELAHFLEFTGLDLVETDLGEFIIQISHDKPSHLVAPIIHKDRASIARLFSEYFKTPYNDDPTTLTAQARSFLRNKFRVADLGITGGNFLVAETGQVCIVENEGNARQSVTTPRVLVSLVGIEKMVPRLADLAVMLKLLARSSTGQRMTVYTTIFGGPRSRAKKTGRRNSIWCSSIMADPKSSPTPNIAKPFAAFDAALPERLPRLPQDRRARVRKRLSRPHRCAHYAPLPGTRKIQGFAAGQQPLRSLLRSLPRQDQHPSPSDQPSPRHHQSAIERPVRTIDLPALGPQHEKPIDLSPFRRRAEIRSSPPRA